MILFRRGEQSLHCCYNLLCSVSTRAEAALLLSQLADDGFLNPLQDDSGVDLAEQ